MMEIIRMIVVLSLITGSAGFALSGLKQWTDPIIEGQVLTYVQGPVVGTIFSDYSNDPIADRKVLKAGDRDVTVFPIVKDGSLTGVAFETAAGGYGGDIGVMVGFNIADNNLAGIGITTHKETPGLGSRVAEPNFTRQFIGHNLDQIALSSQGGTIDAISGSTVSSTGTVAAVADALKVYAQLSGDIKQSW